MSVRIDTDSKLIVALTKERDNAIEETHRWKEAERAAEQRAKEAEAEHDRLKAETAKLRSCLGVLDVNLAAASPWTEWHTKGARQRISAVLDGASE